MEKEHSTKIPYEALSAPEKIRVILGAVARPIPKEVAIKYSQIDYDNLDEEARTKVDAVFSAEDVESSTQGNLVAFRLGEEARKNLAEVVDMKSVDISGKMLGDAEIDLDD